MQAASSTRKKIVIDTDPGIDDAMAILIALEVEELEVIGVTTIFGNTPVEVTTKNALRLLEMAGKSNVPVARGKDEKFSGEPATHNAKRIHGADGMGNTNLPDPTGSPVVVSAVDFLVDSGLKYPGEVYVLALGPLTNVAGALRKDPDLANRWAGIVCMGGAYAMNGNVNPAAEANMLADPEAADYVFEKGHNVVGIGLDVTTKCLLNSGDIEGLKGIGKYGNFFHSIIQHYLKIYRDSYQVNGIYPHDAIALLALISEDLFDFKEASVLVETKGITRGHTVIDSGWKTWLTPTPWCDRPKAKIALGVDHEKLLIFLKSLLMA